MSKGSYKTKRLYLSLLASIALWSAPAHSLTITALDENFNDVTGLSNAGTTRTIANILSNNPAQLPTNTSWSSTNSSPASNINVRRADNTINTSMGTEGFDSFFTPATPSNNFLVLGDNSGVIGSTPSSGVMAVSFPLIIPNGAHSITVSYRYAFDGFDSTAADDLFSVLLTDGSDLLLMSISSPDDRPSGSSGNISAGTFMQTFTSSDLPLTSDLLLTFRLSENSSSYTNTAVGIDDIVVTAQAPEPSSVLLLGSGLISFGILARRYRKKTK